MTFSEFKVFRGKLIKKHRERLLHSDSSLHTGYHEV